jgi:RHS repeat-associated protein
MTPEMVASDPNNHNFTNGYSLYYNRARYLNTATGRFWSMDTAEGDPQAPLSLHKYLYASCDPVNRLDPRRVAQAFKLAGVYGYDGHGSVRQLTNTAGAVTDSYDYDAFGNLINQTGSTPNVYLFAGEQFDPALGLYYNRARYLNTATGRFWSMDTYEGVSTSPLSLHKYLYASANPVNRVDASGNQDTTEEVAAEADGEIVEGAADEEASAARKALNAQVVDIYECAKWQLFRVPYHSWPYANLPGNQGFRYDIGANQINGQVLTGPVPGGLYITETTLDAVQQDANSKFTKQASLSSLRFVEWDAFVIGTAIFVETTVNVLGESVTQFEREYGLGPPYLSPDANTQIGDAINCIIFTKLAIAEAKKLQGED